MTLLSVMAALARDMVIAVGMAFWTTGSLTRSQENLT